MINRNELADWKHHPITQEFFQAIKQRIADLKEEVIDNALSADPRILAWKAGAIQALRDILDTDFEGASW